jgi:signal transduction histidine kinase
MKVDGLARDSWGRFSIPSVAAIGVFIASLVLSFGLLVFYQLRGQTLEREARARQADQAEEISTELESYLLTAAQLSRTSASLMAPLRNEASQVEATLLQVLASGSPDYIYGVGAWYEPGVFDPAETWFGPYAFRPMGGQAELTYQWTDPDYNFHEQAWYQQAKAAGGEVVFTAPYFDTDLVYLSIAQAFMDEAGAVVGVVTVDMVLPLLQQLILDLNTRPEEEIYILTAEGQLFVHPQAAALLDYAAQQGRPQESILGLNADDLAAFRQERDTPPLVSSLEVVELAGWQVSISTQERVLFAPITELRNQVFLGGALLWGISSFLLLALYRLNRQLQSQAQERFHLAQELQASEQAQATLEQINQLLEERVRERTSELELAKNEAERANRSKSAFLASMSHELRTPLNAVINFSKFVANGVMGPVNEKQATALQKVIFSGKHLLNLINDVLDMSKIESGSLTLFLEEGVDLEAIFQNAAATTGALLAEKPQVKFQMAIPADLPTLYADRQRVLQVLLNLLSNAAKFTEQGSIRLSAQAIGEGVQIAIEDSGPGIPPEDQEKIFLPFQQSTTGLAHGGGTGLGLPISKWLVEAHGGRLWLESQPGQGAKFSFFLPIRALSVGPNLKTEEAAA